jgi:hypothetical protein
MEATNTQQKALAYFSKQLKKVEAWLQQRDEVIKKELSAEAQRMDKDGIAFPAITAMLNVGKRNNLEDVRMYYEYAVELSISVTKLQHLEESQAKEYLHRRYLENRDLATWWHDKIKQMIKQGKYGTSLVEAIACQRVCENLVDDFTIASQL